MPPRQNAPGKGGRGQDRAGPSPDPGLSQCPSRAPAHPARTTGTRGTPSGCHGTAGAPGPGSRGSAGGERSAAASPFGSDPSALPSSASPCPRLCPAWGEQSRAVLIGLAERSRARRSPPHLYPSCQPRPHISPSPARILPAPLPSTPLPSPGTATGGHGSLQKSPEGSRRCLKGISAGSQSRESFL